LQSPKIERFIDNQIPSGDVNWLRYIISEAERYAIVTIICHVFSRHKIHDTAQEPVIDVAGGAATTAKGTGFLVVVS
jgi:hypothetical protein